jgi:hypothetical protein
MLLAFTYSTKLSEMLFERLKVGRRERGAQRCAEYNAARELPALTEGDAI